MTRPQQQSTNALLFLTIFNHASWSTLHVASRFLQVYAKPIPFDGQGVLSSAKGSAALFLFVFGALNSWIESYQNNYTSIAVQADEDVAETPGSPEVEIPSTLPSVNATLSASASCLCNSTNNSNSNLNEMDDAEGSLSPSSSLSEQNKDADLTTIQEKQSLTSYSSLQTSQPRESSDRTTHQNDAATSEGLNNSTSPSSRTKVMYTLLFAFVATSRASSNIASSKFTYPYNITLISSFTPVIIALLDRLFLSSPMPPLLWPTIFISGFGGALIAISQSYYNVHNNISRTDNLIGCSLQLLSAIFSAFARILMKRTEGILTSTHIVQTNNISNCLFPFIYTIIYNPSSWLAFRYLLTTPKSLLAWCTMSFGVYSFASTLQIRLVRQLGPGFYSSWVAIRVLGSMILSTVILGEGIQGWLEWVGICLMIGTISIYLVKTREWMEEKKEGQDGIQEQDSGEELVPVSHGENNPLLSGTGS